MVCGGNIAYGLLTVSGGVDHVLIDNVTYSASSAVREPSIISLFALGLSGLGFARRRKA
ncbi:MAG: hypothetical protein ACI8Z1_002111 [Candidatus Azotimanducaceae bacterium]|jgi:hypothetical protein